MKTLLAILWLLVLLAVPCAAQTVTLAWDLSVSDSMLGPTGGYRIYQSKNSGTYTTPIATTAPGITTVTFAPGQLGRLYWVARAFESGGIESDNSNEVTDVIKPKPPKLNTVTQVAQAIKGAVTKVASLFKAKKNLRIVEVN